MPTFAEDCLDQSTATLKVSRHDPVFFRDPYPVYAEIHRYGGPVFWDNIGHWCFAGYERVNALLRDRRFGRAIEGALPKERESNHPAFDAVEAFSLLELEPPAHTRLRMLVNRAFVSRQIERLSGEISALANELIDGFAADGGVELLSSFGQIIPIRIISRIIGMPEADASRLLDWSHSMVRMYLFERSRADEAAAEAASRAFSAYLRELIAEKRRRPGDDLLTRMIVGGKDGVPLTNDELVSTTILLLNAGHEATVHQIGNAVATILASGLPPATLFSNDDSSAATVEECLRFRPPLHLFMRYALCDLETDGIALRKGDQIGLLLAAANRDPQAFTLPDRFDPSLKRSMNLSFGAGIHFCLGAPLARMELQIALATLFRRLPHLRLAQEPRIADTFHFHGYERLDLVW